MAASKRALVVGAGIGGLTAAAALRQHGFDVSVFERAGSLDHIRVGGGIHLWPNAVRALRQIGLGDAAVAAGMPMEDAHFRSLSGEMLVHLKVGLASRNAGAPTVGILRPAIHAVLLQGVGANIVRVGSPVAGYRLQDRGVTVRFEDGREEQGDLLVGADGVRSTIREQTLHDGPPLYGGTSWLGVVNFVHPAARPDLWSIFWGPGLGFITYHVAPGKVAWIANMKATEGAKESPPDAKRRVLDTYAGWPEPVVAMVEATDPAVIARTDLYYRRPTKRWGEGCVTLLGDAAHPMTPHVAQGACQAIEDAVSLAKTVRGTDDIGAAILRYEKARIARTSALQNRARVVAKMADWKHPAAVAFRDKIFFKQIFARVAQAKETEMFSHEV